MDRRATSPGGCTRRVVLGTALAAATLRLQPSEAAEPDAFALLEAGFAARLKPPEAFAASLGMGGLEPGPATGSSYRQFLARARPGAVLTALEMRLSRARPSGIAVVNVRPSLPITPDTVRAVYGDAVWGDVRPELPLFYLIDRRPGGSLAFGFPRGVGTLNSAVLTWGDWA